MYSEFYDILERIYGGGGESAGSIRSNRSNGSVHTNGNNQIEDIEFELDEL